MASVYMSHCEQCSCKLFPVQHIFMPQFTLCSLTCVLHVSLHHVSYAYTLKGLPLQHFPWYVPTLISWIFFLALSFFKNPENSQAKQGYKERQENCSWIEKSIQ